MGAGGRVRHRHGGRPRVGAGGVPVEPSGGRVCWIWGFRRSRERPTRGSPPSPNSWLWTARRRSWSSRARGRRRSPSRRSGRGPMIFWGSRWRWTNSSFSSSGASTWRGSSGSTALMQERIQGDSFEGLLGSSPSMQAVFNSIRKVATTDAPVLILGESGTGKEMTARAIHHRSARKDGSVCRNQLRRDSGDSDGERAFRTREGLVHRSAHAAQRADRKRRRRERFSWMRSGNSLRHCR